MLSDIVKFALVGLSVFLISACETQSVEPAPEFLVDDGQSQELTQIIRSVRQQLSRSNYASLTEQKVIDELGGYDARIKEMLSDEQWARYDTEQRNYWINRIYASLRKDLSSRDNDWENSSYGDIGGGDRSDGAFGSNDGGGPSADPDDR